MRYFFLLALYASTATADDGQFHILRKVNTNGSDGALLRILPTGFSYTEASGVSLTASSPAGLAVTTTRASARTCTKSDGTLVNLTSNQPCVAGSPIGLYSEVGVTNQCIRSEEFDNASWTKTNVTVTANQAVAPDGATTMDSLQSTVAGGFVESTASTAPQNKAVASVYVKTAAGTQAGKLVLRDTTAGADICTVTFTATTTTTRYWCRTSGGATVTNNHTLRLYPGSTGTGTMLMWGAQLWFSSTGVPLVRYVPTAGTSVNSAQDVVTVANPLPADGWCYGMSVERPEVGWITTSDLAVGGGLGSPPSGANTSSMGAQNTAIGVFILAVNDAAAAAKSWSSGVVLTAAEHRICGCVSSGTGTIYLDGASTPTTPNGAGTGIMGAAPASIRLGSLSSSQAGTVKFRNFAYGTNSGVCNP